MPDEQLISELKKIFSAIFIYSPAECSFAGQKVALPPAARQSAQAAYVGPASLTGALQMYLYQYCYTRRLNGEVTTGAQQKAGANNDLVRELSEANAGRQRWDSGWQVYQVDSATGAVYAHKQGQVQTFWPGQYMVLDGSAIQPRAGAVINVFLAKEMLNLMPGYCFVLSEVPFQPQVHNGIVRFYWNIKSDGVIELVRHITERFNRFQVPFQFKCPSNEAAYVRTDAAVLYVNRRFCQISVRLINQMYGQLREGLKPEIPLFARRLASGLGLAEDPGNGESFGMHRCRLVAEGIWNAYLKGLQTEQARLDEVVGQFKLNGISLEHPHLSPGSVDNYEAVEAAL